MTFPRCLVVLVVAATTGTATNSSAEPQTAGGRRDASATSTSARVPKVGSGPITILHASYGPAGAGIDVTARLAAECNGREHCAHRVDDPIVGCHMRSPLANVSCTNVYVAEWSCGRPEPRHQLVAKLEPGGEGRLRLSCGVAGPIGVHVQPEPASPAAGETARGTTASRRAGPVRGTVVSLGSRSGLAGARVVLGKRSTTTDGQGKFAFNDVPPTYDVTVVEPDTSRVTTYLGLGTRTPILMHEWRYPAHAPRHRAWVTGFLLQAPPSAGDRRILDLYYLGDAPERPKYQRFLTDLEAPTYGPFTVEWSGPSSTAGTLVAFVWSNRAKRSFSGAAIASVPLDLDDGDAVYQNLQPRPVSVGRIAGSAEMYPGHPASYSFVSYQLPGARGGVDLGECRCRGAFDCEVPDLSSLGGSYCVMAQDSDGRARVTKCGARLGTSDLVVKALALPELEAGVAEITLDKGARVSWTGVERALYAVELEPDFRETTPVASIRFFTTRTQLVWPDLVALGVKIPGTVRYNLKVAALVPYASVDELASSRGPAVKSGGDFQQLESRRVQVKLVGPVPKPRPAVPSNVRELPAFPDGLPTCSSTRKAQSLAAFENRWLGTKVTLRGSLGFGSWACTLMGCVDDRHPCCVNTCSTQWTISDPAVPVRVVRLERGLGANECQRPKSPAIEVVATGTLLDGPMRASGADSYVLADANLCLVRGRR